MDAPLADGTAQSSWEQEIQCMPKAKQRAAVNDASAESEPRAARECCGPITDAVDLGGAFDYFKWVYSVVKTREDIERALLNVLDDFRRDHVVYLELRSTLKSIPEEGITAQSYADMLVRGCREAEEKWGMAVRSYGFSSEHLEVYQEEQHLYVLYILDPRYQICLPHRVVRIIVSLDRSRMTDQESAERQIEDAFEAARRHPQWIVGFDIAGRPDAGDISSTLVRLKKEVLDKDGEFHGAYKVTVHTAELPDRREETKKIMDLSPHRIGHGCFLTEEERRVFTEKKTIVEVCPTSNICTMQLPCISEHPFRLYHRDGRHLTETCICTDDVGLFRTTLSRELQMVASAYELSPAEVFDLQRTALEAAFCSQDLKSKLYETYFSDAAREKFATMPVTGKQ